MPKSRPFFGPKAGGAAGPHDGGCSLDVVLKPAPRPHVDSAWGPEPWLRNGCPLVVSLTAIDVNWVFSYMINEEKSMVVDMETKGELVSFFLSAIDPESQNF